MNDRLTIQCNKISLRAVHPIGSGAAQKLDDSGEIERGVPMRDDSPAAKAGLKAGDRVVKMAGHDVKNVYDYTYALGEMKAGQEYEVELIRDGKRITFRITPEARK